MKSKIKKFFYSALALAMFAPALVSATDWSFSISSGSSGSTSSSSSSSGGWSLGNVSGFGLPSGSIYGIVGNILLWILAIFGFVGVIGFVISGIMYLLSAGEDTRMETAKKAMEYSIIGVVIGLAGVVIIQAVDSALRQYSSF